MATRQQKPRRNTSSTSQKKGAITDQTPTATDQPSTSPHDQDSADAYQLEKELALDPIQPITYQEFDKYRTPFYKPADVISDGSLVQRWSNGELVPKEVRFQLSPRDSDTAFTQSQSSLHDTGSSLTGSYIAGDNSEHSIEAIVNTESGECCDDTCTCGGGVHVMSKCHTCPPKKWGFNVSPVNFLSGFRNVLSSFNDTVRNTGSSFNDTVCKSGRAFSKVFGRVASDCVESGDVIQLVSRASGRPIQIVENEKGEMIIDAKGVFSIGVSDPVVFNSSWGVIKDPEGSVRLCNLNKLIASIDGKIQILTAEPGVVPGPETQFDVYRRRDHVVLQSATDRSYVTFNQDGDLITAEEVTSGDNIQFSVNLVLTSIEVARGETTESIVEHFLDESVLNLGQGQSKDLNTVDKA